MKLNNNTDGVGRRKEGVWSYFFISPREVRVNHAGLRPSIYERSRLRQSVATARQVNRVKAAGEFDEVAAFEEDPRAKSSQDLDRIPEAELDS